MRKIGLNQERTVDLRTNMKSLIVPQRLSYFFWAISLLWPIAAMTALEDVPKVNSTLTDIPSAYSRIQSACSRESVGEVLTLLELLDESDLWSFGAGLGPTDGRYLQLRLLDASKSFLLNVNGEIAEGSWPEGIVTPIGDSWAAVLSIRPVDTAGLITLMTNTNPAKRLIALEKCSRIAIAPKAMVEAVQARALSDEYVIIVRKPIEWHSSEFPPPTGQYVSDFEAPLRTRARELLDAWGLAMPMSNLANDAWTMVWDQYDKRVSEREEIVRAVNYVDDRSEVKRQLRMRRPATAAEERFLKAFDR